MLQTSPLLVAQVTDTHLFAEDDREMMGCQTARSLQRVLWQIADLQPQPDILLLTGDLSQDETSASYQHLRDAIDPLAIPTYWLPGNHDQQLEVLEQALCSDLISPQKCFQQDGWNFILLDSMVEGKVYGQLSSRAIAQLEQQLSTIIQPTLIALHHPPVSIGSAWMDQIGLQDAEALLTVIDRHPHVKLVVFGHIHQAFAQERNSVLYLGSPSSCVQFSENSPEFAIDPQAPGFRLIWLYPDGRFTTQVKRVTNSSTATAYSSKPQ